eukprot:gene5831-11772_t
MITVLAINGESNNILQWKKGRNQTNHDHSNEYFHSKFLGKIRNWGFHPHSILDVGAGSGTWACETWNIFSSSQPTIFLFEESEFHLKSLQNHPFDYIIAFLSDGMESQKVKQSNAYTLDYLLHIWSEQKKQQFPLQTPILMKLSIQGQELSILRGATETLKQVEVILVEASLISWTEGSLVSDVVTFLHTTGFELFDVANIHRNKGTGARRGELLQLDMVFVRNSSTLLHTGLTVKLGLGSGPGPGGRKEGSLAYYRRKKRQRLKKTTTSSA